MAYVALILVMLAVIVGTQYFLYVNGHPSVVWFWDHWEVALGLPLLFVLVLSALHLWLGRRR